MEQQEPTPLGVVRAFHDAWTGGDVAGAITGLAEDVVVHAPGGRIDGRDAYGEFLASFVPSLTGAPLIDQLEDGEHVVLLYYPQTKDAAEVPAAEYFTVVGGQITAIVLIFDRLSYGPPPGA